MGHGAGTRDTPGRPNVLRLIVGEEVGADGEAHRVLVIEAEMDDMSPQLLGPLLDRLLAAGALDAFFTPVQMKKGRPGVLLTVIAEPERRDGHRGAAVRGDDHPRRALAGVGAHGARARDRSRSRRRYGTVAVKVGRRGRAGSTTCSRSSTTACACARAASRPVKEVWAAALSAYHAGKRK